MNLQTKIPLKPEQHLIDHHAKVLLLGSCFVENIGKKLDYYKFNHVSNPFGILFQPLAIENLIKDAVTNKDFTETDIFFKNEQWHCFKAHSKLSNTDKQELLNTLNSSVETTLHALKNASHIIITLGTAWVYQHLETNSIVANCHKLPQKKFRKELLAIKTVSESIKTTITLIKHVNPNANIVFTISPIRHIKDGFIENTQSKAHLIAAVHQIVKKNNAVYYFPSYEIMMDELRDYRFYAEDMIHPNKTAINYIWNKFSSVWISKATKQIMEDIATIQKSLNHKPFNPSSEAHKLFLKKLKSKQLRLKQEYPHITFF